MKVNPLIWLISFLPNFKAYARGGDHSYEEWERNLVARSNAIYKERRDVGATKNTNE